MKRAAMMMIWKTQRPFKTPKKDSQTIGKYVRLWSGAFFGKEEEVGRVG
jgi:hypothetical protein